MVTQDELAPLVALMRQRVLVDCTTDSCVITCKATQLLLRTVLGLDTLAVTASALVSNARFNERLEAGLPPLEDPEAWSVGLGVDPPAGKVSHLVLINREWLIDPSLDQANRPLLPIEATAFALEGGAFETFRSGRSLGFRNRLGVSVSYKARPNDFSFTASPNWGNRDRSLVQRMVGDVIRTWRAAQ